MPLKVGLTGNIGSGKSTVARLLVAKGAALIDSDVLSREATNDPVVLEKIAKELGADLVEANDKGVLQLNRVKTAQCVFSTPSALAALNAIIHPWVRERSDKMTSAFAKQPVPPQIILCDIPLLYEAHLETTVDYVVVVDASLDVRIKRVMARNNCTEAEVIARDNKQMPLHEKVARADFVLDNSSNEEHLKKQVDALWEQLVKKIPAKF